MKEMVLSPPSNYDPKKFDKRGRFMTHTGNEIDIRNFRIKDVEVEEIAHSLALTCRYGGHCRTFYCPTPDQRILTSNLRWVPAETLKVGTPLVGFDDKPWEQGSAGKNRRKFRPSVVTHVQPVLRPVYRIVLEDGSEMRSSAEHPWLVVTKAAGNQDWVPTSDLLRDLERGRDRYMTRFSPVWETKTTYEAGWLAGMLEGEGHLSFKDRKGVQAGISQNPGPVLERLKRELIRQGVDFGETPTGDQKCVSLQIRGGWREILRIVGSVRAERLVRGFESELLSGGFSKQFDSLGGPLKVVAVEYQGEKWVTGIETSTHTYLCEGFAAHNSVAQHSVMVARYLESQGHPLEVVLQGLHHDDSEAYLGDVIRPLKMLLPNYREIEEGFEMKIAKAFKLEYPFHPAVKEADMAIFRQEVEDVKWDEPDDPIIIPWTWGRAKREYLKLHEKLMNKRIAE